MKKTIRPVFLLVGFTIWAFLIFGQNSEQKSAYIDKRKIELDYGTYSSQLNVNWREMLDPSIKERVKWRQGEGRFYQALFSKLIKNGFLVFGGVGYNMVHFEQISGFWFKPIDATKYGATEVVSIRRHVYLNAVEFPVGILKEWTVNRFEFRAGVGIRTMLYESKNQSIDFYLDNGTTQSFVSKGLVITHDPQINISIELKAGLSYKLFSRLSLKVEPFFRYNIRHDLILDFLYGTRISGLGVLFGLEYPILSGR